MEKMTEEEKSRCIGIVAYIPKFLSGKIKNIDELAPKKKTLSDYKNNHNKEEYTRLYLKQLKELTAEKIIELIPEDAILLCYESSEKFCHRHLLAEFLKQHGIDIEEYH